MDPIVEAKKINTVTERKHLKRLLFICIQKILYTVCKLIIQTKKWNLMYAHKLAWLKSIVIILCAILSCYIIIFQAVTIIDYA